MIPAPSPLVVASGTLCGLKRGPEIELEEKLSGIWASILKPDRESRQPLFGEDGKIGEDGKRLSVT